MVRVTDVRGGFLDLSDAFLVAKDVFDEFTRRHRPRCSDIIFSRVGTYGNASYVGNDIPFCLGQNTALIHPKMNSRFLHLCLQSPFVRRQIEQSVVGSTQKTISLKSIAGLQIPIPPAPELGAIAHILGTLDDKIALNRRMNTILEAVAQAVFKSWFVDFEPVRAKAEGRQPTGMNADTAALFPRLLKESAIGSVPTGWGLSGLGQVTTTVLGGTPARDEPAFWDGGTVPWINSGKVNEFRITTPSELITERAVEESATKLVPARSVVLAITGATLGQVSLLEIESCVNQSVVAVVSSDAAPSEYLYFWIRHRIGDLIGRQTGGAQQHVNKNDVNELILLIPDQAVMDAYIRQARPVFDRIRLNCFESGTLAALRDALLPRLLSGEVRVGRRKASVQPSST